MRKIIVPFIGIVLIAGCATVEHAPRPTEKTCWVHNTHHVKGVTNTLNLCVKGEHASMLVEYPNVGNEPNSCYQEGEKKSTSTGFKLALSVGQCKNGRKLAANRLSCSSSGEGLTCIDTNGLEFNFAKNHNKANH